MSNRSRQQSITGQELPVQHQAEKNRDFGSNQARIGQQEQSSSKISGRTVNYINEESIYINRGATHGVKSGQYAIFDNGSQGRVISVFPTRCKVALRQGYSEVGKTVTLQDSRPPKPQPVQTKAPVAQEAKQPGQQEKSPSKKRAQPVQMPSQPDGAQKKRQRNISRWEESKTLFYEVWLSSDRGGSYTKSQLYQMKKACNTMAFIAKSIQPKDLFDDFVYVVINDLSGIAFGLERKKTMTAQAKKLRTATNILRSKIPQYDH